MPPRRVRRTQAHMNLRDMAGTTGEIVGVELRRRPQGILALPTDVINEMIACLHPRALLNLARTSKRLRAYIMQKSSASLWRRSLQNVADLPACPDGVAEPAWVNLMFSTCCTVCGANTANDPLWVFYGRFCTACSDAKIIVHPTTDRLPNDEDPDIPSSIVSRVALPMSYLDIQKRSYYLRSEIDEVVAEWTRLTKEGTEDEMAMYIGKRTMRAIKIQKHSELCVEWAAEEARRVRGERLDELMSKLIAEGYQLELDILRQNTVQFYVKIFSHGIQGLVTEEDWAQALIVLRECLKQSRQERITAQTASLKENRWDTLKGLLEALAARPEARRYHMSLADVALLPEVRAVALDTQIGEENVQALHAQFGEAVEKWKTRACEKLRDLVRAGLVDGPILDELEHEVDPLELATTKFRCRCVGPYDDALFYPAVLSHRCQQDVEPRPAAEPTSDAYETFVLEQLGDTEEGRAWTLNDLVVDETTQLSRKLFDLCGKNPDLTTAAEMDEADVWFVLRYANFVMTWRTAVLDQDRGAKFWEWRLATPEEREVAREREQKIRDEADIWGCGVCPEVTGCALSDVLQHIQREHGVADPAPDHEYAMMDYSADGSIVSRVHSFDMDSFAAADYSL